MLRVFSRSSSGVKGWVAMPMPALSTTIFSARRISSIPQQLQLQQQQQSGLVIRDGKAVLYRGPPAMKKWIFMFIGGVFVSSG